MPFSSEVQEEKVTLGSVKVRLQAIDGKKIFRENEGLRNVSTIIGSGVLLLFPPTVLVSEDGVFVAQVQGRFRTINRHERNLEAKSINHTCGGYLVKKSSKRRLLCKQSFSKDEFTVCRPTTDLQQELEQKCEKRRRGVTKMFRAKKKMLSEFKKHQTTTYSYSKRHTRTRKVVKMDVSQVLKDLKKTV